MKQFDLKNKMIDFIEKIYYDQKVIEKLENFIKEIDDIIKPKKDSFSYQEIMDLRDLFFEIKSNDILYSLANYKYKNRINVLNCLFYEELNIMKIYESLNHDISKNELIVELDYELNIDELIYLNYLYNLMVNSFIKDRKVNIILINKNKNKVKIK